MLTKKGCNIPNCMQHCITASLHWRGCLGKGWVTLWLGLELGLESGLEYLVELILPCFPCFQFLQVKPHSVAHFWSKYGPCSHFPRRYWHPALFARLPPALVASAELKTKIFTITYHMWNIIFLKHSCKLPMQRESYICIYKKISAYCSNMEWSFLSKGDSEMHCRVRRCIGHIDSGSRPWWFCNHSGISDPALWVDKSSLH